MAATSPTPAHLRGTRPLSTAPRSAHITARSSPAVPAMKRGPVLFARPGRPLLHRAARACLWLKYHGNR